MGRAHRGRQLARWAIAMAFGPFAVGACGSSDPARGKSDAGADAAGDVVDPFAECSEPSISTCSSVSATCDALAALPLHECGKPLSHLDANGCPRRPCTADAQCPPGDRCFSTAFMGCVSSSSLSCSESEVGTCYCHGTLTADCGGRAYCLPLEDAPPADDCSVAGVDCSGLSDWKWAIDTQIDHLGLSADLVVQLQACREKVVAEELASGCP